MTVGIRDLLSWAQDYVYAAERQLRAITSRSGPRGFQTGDGCPVVIIPGVYETWKFLQPLITRVHDAGHPVYVVDRLSWNLAPVPDAARHVADLIFEERLAGVVLLAHSKGGLIGKFVMTGHDAGSRIAGMIAVAAPFSGSSYARYMLSPGLRSFAASNEHITGLNANTETNRKITSIFARFDPHIPEGSALAGATNIEIDAGGHFRLLADVRVADAVLTALAGFGQPRDGMSVE
ncbi:alpha/beta hydrolase [Cryobacterium glaciale]|uniref:Alpha/beta hydrolase n=1 Tax=Cryobacterium glaciale TaxID=1259145 RepID=A0A4R8UV28_9MICO|nr:alpha/beta hydrolase [Cryobacterium glaciale]TFB71366.1 alpha/beta hydrolase [Cryobacterium glaciale]